MALSETTTTDKFVYTLVRKIASSAGRTPTELPPLSNAVDPEALASLLDNSHSNELSVKFEYCEHDVTVDGTGHVEVARKMEHA